MWGNIARAIRKILSPPRFQHCGGWGPPSPRRSDASGAEACATIAYRAHCDQGTKATAIKRVSERERKYGIVYTLTLHTLRHRRRTDYRPRMPALSSLLTFACSESVEHHIRWRRLWLPHTEMFLCDFNVFSQFYCFYLFRLLHI